jgi:hypothetical protein
MNGQNGRVTAVTDALISELVSRVIIKKWVPWKNIAIREAKKYQIPSSVSW